MNCTHMGYQNFRVAAFPSIPHQLLNIGIFFKIPNSCDLHQAVYFSPSLFNQNFCSLSYTIWSVPFCFLLITGPHPSLSAFWNIVETSWTRASLAWIGGVFEHHGSFVTCCFTCCFGMAFGMLASVPPTFLATVSLVGCFCRRASLVYLQYIPGQPQHSCDMLYHLWLFLLSLQHTRVNDTSNLSTCPKWIPLLEILLECSWAEC